MEKKELMQVATSQELTNSLNFAFGNLVCSKKFSDLPKNDREKMVFHWELFRDFLAFSD